MNEHFIVPLLFSLSIYLYLPQPEYKILGDQLDITMGWRCNFILQVIFQSTSNTSQPVERIANISWVSGDTYSDITFSYRRAFKIILNADSHMEHVDTSKRVKTELQYIFFIDRVFWNCLLL